MPPAPAFGASAGSGERWQTALAEYLGVADRTVRRWVAGESPVPDHVWPFLAKRIVIRRIV
jgi:hypothetical protein